MTRMRVSLVTLGDPNQQTGGYLYHRRLADAAPRYDADIRFVSFPDRMFPLPLVAGRAVLNDAADADVVVVDSIAAAFAAPWLGTAQPPVVGAVHQRPGGIDHRRLRSLLQAALDRQSYRHMRMLLVASESLRDELVDVHDDIHVVPPGRDVADRVDPPSSDLRAGRDTAFVCVANWIPRKGIVELLEAFALLPQEAATLHLVGDERVHPRYAAEVRRWMQPLKDRVVAHGVVSKERVAGLYAKADAFVMPSFQEPYGTVYAEAMAMGLPVVGWRAGNLPYLARHEKEGLIVDPGDTAALAAALQALADDVELRRKLGEAARARAETFPTWDQTAATFFSTLRTLLSA